MADAKASICPATREDIGGLIELLRLRPPMHWIVKVSDARLAEFLEYAVKSPRAVLLAARAPGDAKPAGYVLSALDAKRFWFHFGLRKPVAAQAIAVHRLRRLFELRRRINRVNSDGGAYAGLPPFAWTASDPGCARILGIFVRREHRRKGIAGALYAGLLEEVKARGGRLVEAYLGPDYARDAGSFPEACGWDLRRCDSGGFKVSKSL